MRFACSLDSILSTALAFLVVLTGFNSANLLLPAGDWCCDRAACWLMAPALLEAFAALGECVIVWA